MDNYTPIDIFNKLGIMFPNARCELNYSNPFELVVAVVLSAQTTDDAVNNITKDLFNKYPNAFKMAEAQITDIQRMIKSIGLYVRKSMYLIQLSQDIVRLYNGEIPSDFNKLTSLPGIGQKTANVILAECFNIPRIAVDTHVLRVSKRLGLVKSNNPLVVEKELMKLFDENDWRIVHLRLLFFGRYFCKAIKPSCETCPFKDICTKTK